MIRIVYADASGDPLELLSSRVSRTEMTLHMPEQRWHLTKYVVRRREVEELSLCGVEVARRPLDKRPIAEDPEPLARVWLLRPSRLPGRVKVTLNRRHKRAIALPWVLQRYPVAQCLEFLGPRQGAFAPGHRHWSPDRSKLRGIARCYYMTRRRILRATAIEPSLCDLGLELAHRVQPPECDAGMR